MTHTVVGIFNSANDAQTAADQLRQNGFNESDIDYTSGNDVNYDNDHETRDVDENESGISRFFRNLFGDNDESDRYSRAARNGYVVSVYANSSDEAENAKDILDQYGAIDVDEKDHDYVEQVKADTDRNNISDNTINNEGSKKIPIIEEELQVRKKVVETGGVRVRSRIVEKPAEQTIRLRKEHVTVERNKVDRPVSDKDFFNFKDGTTEVREHEEVPVVSKNAKVVEEVSLDTTVDHRDETVRDKVRRTEVDVENLDRDDNTRSDL